MKKIIILFAFLIGFNLQCMEEKKRKNQDYKTMHDSARPKKLAKGEKEKDEESLLLRFPAELQANILKFVFYLNNNDLDTVNLLDAPNRAKELLLLNLNSASLCCRQFKAIIDSLNLNNSIVANYRVRFVEIYCSDVGLTNEEALAKLKSYYAKFCYSMELDSISVEEYDKFKTNFIRLLIYTHLNPEAEYIRDGTCQTLTKGEHLPDAIPLLIFYKDKVDRNLNLLVANSIFYCQPASLKQLIIYVPHINFEQTGDWAEFLIPLIDAISYCFIEDGQYEFAEEIAQILLSIASTNVDIIDEEGNTPLIIACREYNIDCDFDKFKRIIRMLLDKGANITVKNNKGRTALYILSKYLKSIDNGKDLLSIISQIKDIIRMVEEKTNF